MYMVSAGNEKAITKTKATITAAVIGFAISISAETFLKEIWSITGATVTGPSSGSSFSTIANNALKTLLSLVGVLGIIGMIMGGIMYLTAYGDEKKATKGKDILLYSIIGVAIALGSVVILSQVDSIVSGS
jgi:predicted peptidase